MFAINNLFKKKVDADLLKNKDFSAAKESDDATRESGRTMTEMLGVLAVIGVLSIGGIAGYSYAMDKYRANTTVNEINMRAVDLVLQSTRGVELNLDEWDDTSMAGYTFDGLGEENDSIYLQISGLPERVCEMVADTLGSQFDLAVNGQHYSENNTTLCGDDNTIRVYFEETGAGVTCDPECGAGEICINGICVDDETQPITPLCSSNESCPECFTCYSTYDGCSPDSGARCGPNGSGICNHGACQYDTCNSDADCAAGEICGDANTSCTSATKPGNCLKVPMVIKTITFADGNKETYYVSRSRVSWWDAQSLCASLNAVLVSVSDLYQNGFTERSRLLQNAGIGGVVWTSDTSANSCEASSVFYSYGFVGTDTPRNHVNDTYGYLALCRGSNSDYSPSGGNSSSGYSPDNGWVTDEVTTGY